MRTNQRAAAALVSFALATAAGATMPATASGINGALYAAVDTAFDGATGPVGSYIRLYNGAAGASTFSILIVGSQTGQTYGHQLSLQIPHNASVQYPLGRLLSLAGAGAASGD